MVRATRSPSVEFSTFRDGKPKVVASISLGPSLEKYFQQQAMRWRYIMRQRNRWSTNEEAIHGIESQATETLIRLGVSKADLKQLSGTDGGSGSAIDSDFRSKLIEISIPWRSEAEDWCARIMPWEYLLSAATKVYRSGERKTIVRRLVKQSSKGRRQNNLPTSFAFLEAAPGVFRDTFDFEREKSLVRSTLGSLQFQDLHAECGRDPDLITLKKWFGRTMPSLLHVSGVDGQLGSKLLNQGDPKSTDGLYLAKKGSGMDLVDPEKFASMIFSNEYRPELVAFNVWHSGARLAPYAVLNGARGAIGFENTFDDSVAELFFAQFYSRYSASDWSLGQAFCHAVAAIGPYSEKIRGSGIVLWTEDSLIAASTTRAFVVKPSTLTRQADPKLDQAQDFVRIEVKPLARLNYANLHNHGTLLESLSIGLFSSNPSATPNALSDSEPSIGSIRNIEVDVTLSTGAESFPYKTTMSLTEAESVVDLARPGLQATENHSAGGICVPLTSELMRTVDESILTNLHVSVEWYGQSLYNRTFQVQLAPVDEWRFEDDQIIWMSSFVQPRDAAVSKIIDTAQRYLACLADDPTAGFGGYQAYDPSAKEPWKGVDLQVQAIWTAISLDFGLSYINPPPSYSENAQRLRSPSRILSEGRGTCVDLALLMAACLEWVEIYPVIFNLNDHAFPGYWRDSEAYERFQREPVVEPGDGTLLDGSPRNDRSKSIPPWYSPAGVYGELRSFVSPLRKANESEAAYEPKRSLIPLETVFLTQRTSFRAAIDEARSYFDNVRSKNFHSMIDVVRSRAKVTPIPLSAIRKSN